MQTRVNEKRSREKAAQTIAFCKKPPDFLAYDFVPLVLLEVHEAAISKLRNKFRNNRA